MSKLKPQSFIGLVDANIPISAAPTKIIKSIESRSDLPLPLSNYLIKLVQYSSGIKSATTQDLEKLYKKIESADRNAIQKDFSELLAPLILLKESRQASQNLKALKLTVSTTSKMFIPAAGNYPLIDFMVRTGNIQNEYSVKTLQKTTNTLKAGDILHTVSNATKARYARETEILKMIDSYDAKVGPILILAKLAPSIKEFKKTHPLYRRFVGLKTVDNDIFKAQPVDWYTFFEPVIDAYYANGKSTINKAWKAKYYFDALTVLAQYAVADITQSMNWMPFVDEVQKKVTYFKFGLNSNGTYTYQLVNGLSERKAGQKFRLRAKSRLKPGAWSQRSGQDKLGIQP